MEEINTPKTLEIEGHIKKKKVQAVKDHVEHQQQVLQLLKDNTTSVQNQTKQPMRDHDHTIILIPGSVPPNIRSYRYPYAQKTEIEHMVTKIIEAGIIQPNQSSFYAPVVLVHKKDGSWHMCLDYKFDKVATRNAY